MKLITEFNSFTIQKGLTQKNALVAEGKTAEEIEQTIGTSFKLEAEKLKHFLNAIDVGAQNSANLKRVFVATLAEGENTPAKAIKIEETVYVPEFLILTPFSKPQAPGKGKGGGRGGPRSGDKKGSSPWGMSPEEKAAKNSRPAPGTK